jgi:ribosomal protein S18 acetylase RimI-like enzyme
VNVAATSAGEITLVTDVVTEAFLADPVWSWVFKNPQDMRAYWTMFIKSALRYPYVFHTEKYEAVSVWIPPGGSSFLPDDDQNFERIMARLCGKRVSQVLGFLANFDKAHPRSEPHYYLGLLGTAAQHRGQGIGLSLLRHSLRLLDTLEMPAYLESSNSLNNSKYLALGFEVVSSFQVPENGPVVTGMWRNKLSHHPVEPPN